MSLDRINSELIHTSFQAWAMGTLARAEKPNIQHVYKPYANMAAAN